MSSPFRRYAVRALQVLVLLVPAAIGVGLAYPLLQAKEIPTLSLSAGPVSTHRHAVAEYLRDQAAPNGLTIRLEETAGTEDCLNLLKAGRLDAALVSNGMVVPDDDDVTVVAAIRTEAVHVLVRKELAETEQPLFETIRGKRVNLDRRGCTDRLLIERLLHLARLKLPSADRLGDIVPTEFDKAQLTAMANAVLQAEGAEKAALRAELPDCLFVLAGTPSRVVQKLVEAVDYRLVPLPAVRAFLADDLRHEPTRETILVRDFLEPYVIPAHSYHVGRSFPAEDCPTIGVPLLIVVRKGVSAAAVRPLMQTLFDGEFARRIRPKSPRELASPYPIHPAAIAYLDRDKPLAIDAAMEWVNKIFTVFGAVSAVALSVYGLLWRPKVRQPADYFAEIRKIEHLAQGEALDTATPSEAHELARQLDRRLLKLRQDLIEDICEGRIQGDQVIANILALLKDARRNLPRPEGEPLPSGESILRTYRPTELAA